jgi:Holliday junction resolvasome RuvABC endonuclease subunit
MILGIDASLNSTGIAILDDSKQLIFYSTIQPPKNMSEEEKLIYIQNYMDKLLKQHKIKNAMIEDTFFASNIKTLKTLMKVHGIIISQLNNYTIHYKYKTPTAIKKNIIGKIPKGADSKLLVKQEILKLYPQLPNNLSSDVYDAISIVLMWY